MTHRITALVDTLCIAYEGGLTQHDVAECRSALATEVQAHIDYTKAVINERDSLRKELENKA